MNQHRSGLVVELSAGQAITLRGANGVDSEKIVLILEQKDGRKARLRIQACANVKVGKPERNPG